MASSRDKQKILPGDVERICKRHAPKKIEKANSENYLSISNARSKDGKKMNVLTFLNETEIFRVSRHLLD